MAKAKKLDSSSYPQPQHQESGCKVGWYYYSDLADAWKASKVATKEAIKLAGQGYDFGYQCPGEVRGPIEEGKYQGCYSVVIP